jgi:hypothetical protein
VKTFRLAITFLLCVLFIKAYEQNLVPNGGFDTLTGCPSISNGGGADLASPWFIPNGSGGSPDMYNSCATATQLQVPQNWTGWQMPHSGNGYAGLGAYGYWYNGSNINNREYIAVQLLDTLVAGKKYCVEFYASLADSSFWAVNRLGACLSKHPLSGQPFDTISAIPQIEWNTSLIFSDKSNWIEISGTYISAGGEKYITIGNFYADNQTDTISHLGTWIVSYFYIDDVSVTDCGWSGIQSADLSNGISLFPNPSDGNFQLKGNFPSNSQLHIYNLLGEEIIQPISLPQGDQTIPVELSLAEGIYIYRIISGKDMLHEEKLVIVQ